MTVNRTRGQKLFIALSMIYLAWFPILISATTGSLLGTLGIVDNILSWIMIIVLAPSLIRELKNWHD